MVDDKGKYRAGLVADSGAYAGDCLLSGAEGPLPHARGVFCNRTLNMRSIRAVGYDMDYTLVHYKVDAWELRAYEHLRGKLEASGWPVKEFAFDPELVTRGLIIDLELGNIVKANRFGYVKRAFHGTRPLSFEEQRKVYSRTMVELAKPRWVFLNTLFSLSEACMYAQLVGVIDERRLPEVLGYDGLYRRVHESIDAAHMEGRLKAEVVSDPEKFVLLDPNTALTLLDQKHAGKKLMLITNSDWEYTRSMMAYSFDRYLPEGMTWRALFDVVIVGARKPDFFLSKGPFFEVMSDDGMLKPAMALREGALFNGGDASLVERHLGISGDEILYVGDHMWGDVHVSKSALRWRTALILRELEGEIAAQEAFASQGKAIRQRMAEKEALEHRICCLRLAIQRVKAGYGPQPHSVSVAELEKHVATLRAELTSLDDQIGPLAHAADGLGNRHWGLLLRAGNDKSHLARQVESYADIYTSRVSNLVARSPFAYMRSPQGSMPHDLLFGREA